MICTSEKKVRVTTAQFAAKFKSKKEVYRFMTVDVKAYLCSSDVLTVYFLKGNPHSYHVTILTPMMLSRLDLASGKKKYIRCDDIKTLACPQYNGLNIDAMLQEAFKTPDVKDYLPEERDITKLPR